MTDLTIRQNHALPKQWADEIALVSSAPSLVSSIDNPSLHTPPEAIRGSPIFDKQLDGFLDRFQQEILSARSLKDDLDKISQEDMDYEHKKHNFKLKMEHIRALFSTEGEDFVASLEKRNPHLSMAAYGENTIELAQGIDRLETAVREEETKRIAAGHGTSSGNKNDDERITRMRSVAQLHVMPPTPPQTTHLQQQPQQHGSPGGAVTPAPALLFPPESSSVSNTPPTTSTGVGMEMQMGNLGDIGSISPIRYSNLNMQAHKQPSSDDASQQQAMVTSMVTPTGASSSIAMTHAASADRAVAPPLIPSSAVGHTLQNLTSDETLQLMQSDIQALKLELMRLQRTKVSNGAFGTQPTPHSLPNRSTDTPVATSAPPNTNSISSPENGSPGHGNGNTESPRYSSTYSSNGSPEKDVPLPASILANSGVNVVRVKGRAVAGGAPTYVSHLEQMKSRIEALERKPLSRRAKSVARLGRTHTMGSMYEPNISTMGGSVHISTNGLGSINSKGSLNGLNGGIGDENQNPNVSAMVTPPRNIRRSKRSISTSSPLATLSPNHLQHHQQQVRRSPPSRLSSPVIGINRLSPSAGAGRLSIGGKNSQSGVVGLVPNEMGVGRRSPPGRLSPVVDTSHRFTIATTSPGSSPSPKRPSFSQQVESSVANHQARTGTGGNMSGSPGNTSPARLFFDAPEEMLSRPQSHAAARDIQRYSLKVARRFIPVGGNVANNNNPTQSQTQSNNGNSKIMSERMMSDAGTVGKTNVSENLVEPRAKSAVTTSPTRRRGHPPGHHNHSDLDASIGHTLSEGGPHITKNLGNTTSGGSAILGKNANALVPSDIAGASMKKLATPSTIDTTGSGSAAGRVVEEIEGDMWVRKGVVWKRWRRRYASIISHNFFGRVMCLFSYDSTGGVINTRSQIVVLHGSLCRALRDTVDINGVLKYVLVLRTSSKEYYFAAESDEARRAWVRELREAAKVDNSRISQAMKGRSMAFRKRK